MDTQESEPTSRVRSTTVRVEVAASTHIGGRTTNADALLLDEAAGLYGVADGIGDVPRSALVARMGLVAVHELFPEAWARLPVGERSVNEARERLLMGMAWAHGRLHSPWRTPTYRIGTTFAGIVVCGESLAVGHIGDTRVYLLRTRKAALVQVTRDHTVAGDARRGGLPADQADELADAHKLTQVLGVTHTFAPDAVVWRWEPDDVVLLCSDGVSDHLDADILSNILLDASEVGVAAQRLVDRAIEVGGGRDNATAVVVHRTT